MWHAYLQMSWETPAMVNITTDHLRTTFAGCHHSMSILWYQIKISAEQCAETGFLQCNLKFARIIHLSGSLWRWSIWALIFTGVSCFCSDFLPCIVITEVSFFHIFFVYCWVFILEIYFWKKLVFYWNFQFWTGDWIILASKWVMEVFRYHFKIRLI